ncbi:hypothetical protein M569_16975 [Genlisea aurea]|uniref:Uncharacterized protein n=1 Tax=Genlisea aurea TaxID=192259 RepID=S8D5E7_9LAMI|nr:hypothetical protein M569_16975 [Genlisea aurea]
MDAKEELSDLQGLRKLYDLLRKVGSELLDGSARLLLKNMLDAEAAKFLKPRSEDRITPLVFAEASRGYSPSPKQQHDHLTEMKGYHVKGEDGNLEDVMERQIEIPTVNGPGNRNRRCRICHRNTVKNSDQVKLQNFDASQKLNRFAASGAGEIISSNGAAKGPQMEKELQTKVVMSNVAAESERKLHKVDSLSEEASKAMERIELLISARHQEADRLQLSGHKTCVSGTKITESALDPSQPGKDVGVAVGYIVHPFPFRPPEEINQFYITKLAVPPEAMLRRLRGHPLEELGESPYVESGNWLMKCNGSPYNSYLPTSSFPSGSKEDMHMVDKISACRRSEKGCRGKVRETVEEKHRHFSNVARASSFERQESEDSATNYSYSSSNHGSRDGSWRDLEDMNSNTSIDSGFATPISDTTESSYSSSSYTSNTPPGVYSSSGRSYKSLSRSSSSSDRPLKLHTAPKMARMASSRMRKGSTGLQSKMKQSGMWRRLKDRLAIIFHHHHHHHHHHHRHHKKRMGKELCSGGRGKVMTRKLSSRREDEANGERAIEKMGRSLVQNKKNQHAQFRDLMGGFMRHIRSSKEPKPELETLAKSVAKGDKLGRNKSHWWQLMQNHNGAAKLAKGTSFKLGLVKKKGRLKALPSFK